MKMFYAVFFVALIGPNAFAIQSQTEICKSLVTVQNASDLLRTSYSQLQVDKSNLSLTQLTQKSIKMADLGLRLLTLLELTRLQSPSNEKSQPSNTELILQAQKILQNVKKENYTSDFGAKMLSHTLPKISNAVTIGVFHGQVDNNCAEAKSEAIQISGVKSKR